MIKNDFVTNIPNNGDKKRAKVLKMGIACTLLS